MAHQCLKCGKTYADGSPQILKGCEGCKGTRFFYTDKPLDDVERERLSGKTEIDLERLALGKGGGEAAEPRKIPTKGELPVGRERDQDWVAGGPNYLRGVVEDVVRRAQERKPVFRVGEAPTPKPTLSEWIRQNAATDDADGADADGDAVVGAGPEDLLDDLFTPERESDWRQASRADAAGSAPHEASPRETAPPTTDLNTAAHTRAGDAEAETSERAVPAVGADADASAEDLVYQRAPRPVPKPVSLAGVAIDAQEDAQLRDEAQRARELLEQAKPSAAPAVSEQSGVEESLYPEGQVPETVAVRDSGVYELDVKRLLEKNPIVVHKDGTYSLHLPSLMETLEPRKRR